MRHTFNEDEQDICALWASLAYNGDPGSMPPNEYDLWTRLREMQSEPDESD